jgi:tRNA (mo5U34)-methyltransferase
MSSLSSGASEAVAAMSAPGSSRNGATQPERPASCWTQEEIQQRVLELAPWFHNLNLNGVRTAPGHFLGDYPSVKWKRFAQSIPADLRGRTVLDIGCNAGFYSIEMKRRGADRVVAIDFDPEYLAQARFAAEVNRAEIEFHELSTYEVGQLNEKFDLVLFMGVFYHLRHPLLALDLIREHVTKDLLVFQSMLRGSDVPGRFEKDYPFKEERVFKRPNFPQLYFIEHQYCGDPTNWWIPNRACVEALLRSAGFNILSRPEHEVYICRVNPDAQIEQQRLFSRRRDND